MSSNDALSVMLFEVMLYAPFCVFCRFRICVGERKRGCGKENKPSQNSCPNSSSSWTSQHNITASRTNSEHFSHVKPRTEDGFTRWSNECPLGATGGEVSFSSAMGGTSAVSSVWRQQRNLLMWPFKSSTNKTERSLTNSFFCFLRISKSSSVQSCNQGSIVTTTTSSLTHAFQEE